MIKNICCIIAYSHKILFVNNTDVKVVQDMGDPAAAARDRPTRLSSGGASAAGSNERKADSSQAADQMDSTGRFTFRISL